jgi:hypothetical protein
MGVQRNGSWREREQLEAQGTTEKLDVNIERRALPGSCVPFAGINLVKQIVVIHRRAKEVYLWVESRDGYLWQSLTGCSIVSMKRQIAAINRARSLYSMGVSLPWLPQRTSHKPASRCARMPRLPSVLRFRSARWQLGRLLIRHGL